MPTVQELWGVGSVDSDYRALVYSQRLAYTVQLYLFGPKVIALNLHVQQGKGATVHCWRYRQSVMYISDKTI